MQEHEHFQMPLESINDAQSFTDDTSIPSPTKITGHKSGKHLQESANETAKSMMTGSLIKTAHLFPLSTHPHQRDQQQTSYNILLNVMLQILFAFMQKEQTLLQFQKLILSKNHIKCLKNNKSKRDHFILKFVTLIPILLNCKDYNTQKDKDSNQKNKIDDKELKKFIYPLSGA